MTFRLRDFFKSSRSANGDTANVEKVQQARELIHLGREEEAAVVLRELLAVQPGNAQAWYTQGNVFKNLKRPDDALASYQRALDLQPCFPAALCNRAVVLLSLGRAQEAVEGFQLAIAVSPNDALVYYNLALAQQSLGQRSAALDSYGKAIEVRPDYAEAHFNRAQLNEELAQWQEALIGYDRTIALQPHMPNAHFRRGNLLVQLKRWHDALESFEHAVADDPGSVAACLHHGNVLREMGRWDSALSSYDRAISVKPDDASSHFNRGVLLEQLRRLPEALASFERAIAIQPDLAPAQYNRALALLLKGDLSEGFANYEWRWKNPTPSLTPDDYHSQLPLWMGSESLLGKRILIFSEQGLGDTLQFCRYVKQVTEHGAKVILEVQEPLCELLANLESAAQVIPRGSAIPACDYKVPLLSLPRLLHTTLETIPAERRYVCADQSKVEAWKVRLGAATCPRIGLAWSGNPQYPNDHHRSMPLATLIKLLPREYQYFCLQKEIPEADRVVLASNPQVADYQLDFPDTAALCEHMDLIVSVCTSVAHLAGSMGRPLWLLLAFNADWRWFLDREETPWYPSARLYRQPAIGDWDAVVARVARDLRRNW